VCTELTVLLGNKESLTTPVTIDVIGIGKINSTWDSYSEAKKDCITRLR
jgi:hypothetical protein